MAVAFENCDVIVSEKHAEHINFRHVEINEKRASKFKTSLNCNIALLTRKTWVSELEDGFGIINRGFKYGHGEFYFHVFQLGKVIGYDPYGSQLGNMYILFIEPDVWRKDGCHLSF